MMQNNGCGIGYTSNQKDLRNDRKCGKMKVIGITAGVGSGKSLVLSWLASQTYAPTAVIEADKTAHGLQKKGFAGYDAIIRQFGTDILTQDGDIDRKKLGELVFANRTELERLNAILHPLVKEEIVRQIAQLRSEQVVRFVFIEAALLIEEHYDEICDELWYIFTNKENRIQRLKQSRGYSDEKIRQIMDSQLDEGTFRRKCQIIIDNNGSEEDTFKQIREVLEWQNG